LNQKNGTTLHSYLINGYTLALTDVVLIGGMILFGILGLFVGAIILTLGYELFMAWLNREELQELSNNE